MFLAAAVANISLAGGSECRIAETSHTAGCSKPIPAP